MCESVSESTYYGGVGGEIRVRIRDFQKGTAGQGHWGAGRKKSLDLQIQGKTMKRSDRVCRI